MACLDSHQHLMPLWQRGLLLCLDLAALKAVHPVTFGLQSHAMLVESLQDDLCRAMLAVCWRTREAGKGKP